MNRDNWHVLLGWIVGLCLGLLLCGTGHAGEL